jgi:hypothetical protein
MKKILALLLTAVVVLAAAGCSKKKGQDPGAPAAVEEAVAARAEGASTGPAEPQALANAGTADPCADCPPGSGQAQGGGRHLAAGSRPKVRRTAEELAQSGERLEGLLAELSEASDQASAETYDPQAIVDNVGSDVESLFAWVRDNTWLVPYRGALRGPVGVLMDRVGNSLDRALLLCELLDRAGIRADLAHATLAEGRARVILDKAAPPPAAADETSILSEADREAIGTAAAEYGFDPKILVKTVEDEISRRSALRQQAGRGEAAILPRLLDLTSSFREPDPGMETRQALEDVRDHWWVRAETESGMIDLDPSLPESAPGKTLAEASETVGPDRLDEAHRHQIVLRVVVERWEAGRILVQDVLRREIFPTDVAGQRMILSHVPADWPGTPEEALKLRKAPQGLHALILAQKSWTPVLTIGDEKETGSAFDDSGRLAAKESEGGSSGGPPGGFGGGPGGGPEPPAKETASVLTAEWIEYEILSPGRPLKKVRRELFDLFGPAGRAASAAPRPDLGEAAKLKRSLALLGRTEIVPVVCRWSKEYARYLADGHLLAGQEALLSFFDVDVLKDPAKVLESVGGMDRIPAALYRLATVPQAAGTYISTPNILSLHTLFGEDQNGRLRSGAAIDLVDIRTAVRPSQAAEAFRARLAQGVRNSVWESALAGPRGQDDLLSRYDREAAGPAAGWAAASPGDPSALAKADLPPALAARLRAAVAEGDAVVFPRRQVVIDGKPVFRWWRIDPRTGDALICGERGWGQALSHYVQRVEQVTQMVDWLQLMTDINACLFIAAGAAVGAEGDDWGSFITCVQNLLCNQLYSQFEDSCDLETNWQNFMLKKLAGHLAGEVCDILMEGDTWQGGDS